MPGKVDIIWFFTKRGSSGAKEQIYFVSSDGKKSFNAAQKQFTSERLDHKVNLIGVNKDATLVIKDFTKRDEGVFTCEVQGALFDERSVNVRAVGMHIYL